LPELPAAGNSLESLTCVESMSNLALPMVVGGDKTRSTCTLVGNAAIGSADVVDVFQSGSTAVLLNGGVDQIVDRGKSVHF